MCIRDRLHIALSSSILAIHALEDPLWRRQPFGLGFFGGLLVGALGAERVAHRVVAFVTSILVDLVARLTRDCHPESPWLRERRRVINMDFVVDHLRIDARESLD